MGTVVNILPSFTGEKKNRKISWTFFFYRCILPSWTWSPCQPCFTGFVPLGMSENFFFTSIILTQNIAMCTIVHFTVLYRLRTGYASTSEWWHHLKTCTRESKSLFSPGPEKIVGSNIWVVQCWWKGVRPEIWRDPLSRVLDFGGVKLGEVG